MSSNVVVTFPKVKKNHPPQTLEDMKESINTFRITKAEDVVGAVVIGMIDNLMENGINIQDNQYIKYNTWLLEAVRALVYHTMDVEYPLHEKIEALFEIKSHPDNEEVVGVFWDYNNLKVEVGDGQQDGSGHK